MKKILPALLLALVVCSGCASRYSIILNNGDVLSAHGKPHLNKDEGRYYYKDANGQAAVVSAARVREVSPASMADKGGAQFIK